jgi:uncharacterized protein YndB with AHSA1/START domain
MSDPVIFEVVVAARVDDVWRALREPSEIRRWFGWDYDEHGGLDEEIDQIFMRESTPDDAERVLDAGEGGVISLEERGDATVVRLTRAAPAGQDGWDGIYDEINEGWLTFFQQMRFYLERHAGQERRTVHIATEDGEEWFRSENQAGYVREDGSLVIRTPKRVIVSTYVT